MSNIIELWRVREIKKLKTLIKEKEDLIKKYDFEIKEIRRTRKPMLLDFLILNDKYGSYSANKYDVHNTLKDLKKLKDNPHITAEEYGYYTVDELECIKEGLISREIKA